MSYCHVGGGGIQINFLEIIKKQALFPGKNGASCLGICPYYGCTDPTAINYDSTATIDDGSCIYCVTGLPFMENFNQSIGTFTNSGSAGNWIRNSGPTHQNTGPSNGAAVFQATITCMLRHLHRTIQPWDHLFYVANVLMFQPQVHLNYHFLIICLVVL